MDAIPLNVFQRLARQWDKIHPYNAAQAMRLQGLADIPQIESAWQKTIARLRLGEARVSRGKYKWIAAESAPLQVVAANQSLEQFLSAELNRTFTDDIPLRPFVYQDASTHVVGVIYHHWAADSYSIRRLLHEWFLQIYFPADVQREPMRIARSGYWQSFGPSIRGWNLFGALLNVARWGAQFRKARRVDASGFEDFRTHFSLHHLPDGFIQQIATAAKAHQATVNDLFVAAMARVCDELVPMPRTNRRPDLALGTIVDLRSHLDSPESRAFGLMLGFTSVFVRPSDLRNSHRLLKRVHQQNAMQKRTSAAQASMVRMFGGLVVAKMFGRKKLLEFYRKRLAMAGGISNVNLSRDWQMKYFPDQVVEYIRVSPSGPMMPVVFTPTTLGNTLHFGLTCRTSVISLEMSGQLARRFVEVLDEYCGA